MSRISYTLVVAGRGRQIAKAVTAVAVAIFAFADLYLGTFHPSDMLVGVTVTVAFLVNAFRFFTPNEVFPVAYRQGKTAHLDVGGRRGEAIRHAVQDQLGLTVVDVKPFGLAGSGGSTPLRICVAGDPDTYLFGKLYTMSHVRADRWYKLGRTLLYGRLEDEAPFQSVRPPGGVRGLHAPRDPRLRHPHRGAVRDRRAHAVDASTCWSPSSSTAPPRSARPRSTDEIIDEGLALIRKLWDSGLAHRDIKPANLLVRTGTSSSSTSPSRRCDPHRGVRPSTSPT